MLHDLRHLIEDQGYAFATQYGSRVLIEGAENYPGYGVGYSYPNRGGEAFTFGLCGVIDNHGGTPAEIEREKATRRCFDVKPGDLLKLSDTITVVVTLDRRRYPELKPVAAV